MTHKIEIMKSLFVVQSKDQQLVMYGDKPYLAQADLHQTLLQHNRIVIPKARQLGISTAVAYDYFFDAVFIPNTTMVIIAHNEQLTQLLLEKVKLVYRYLPDQHRPNIFHNSRNEMSFPDMGSRIYIGTAASTKAFGRGDTVHRCLCSELAYWSKDECDKILPGIEEACPLGTGKLALESSPNGATGRFYRIVQEALKGVSPYQLRFYPWWWNREEYSLPAGSLDALPQDRGELELLPDEVDLKVKFNLTDDNIRWRRRKQYDRRDLYIQEYPEDIVTCFLISENSIFKLKAIEQLAREAKPPAVTKGNDRLRIWQLPLSNEQYIIGADTSEGVAGGSWSAGVVVKRRTLEHVATLHGIYDVGIFAKELADLGKFYNEALLAVEKNFTGVAVLDNLVNHLYYPNLYYYTGMRHEKRQLGWVTSSATKPLLISTFQDIIDNMAFTTHDERLLSELRTYCRLDGIKVGALPDSRDDLVMATMIAVYVRNENPVTVSSMPRKVQYFGVKI